MPDFQAFGDAQGHLDDSEKENRLRAVLRDKAVVRLQKGQRALQYLQPPGGEVINTQHALALPNISREYLQRALQGDPDLRQVTSFLFFLYAGVYRVCSWGGRCCWHGQWM